ncbi:uncharacterized protein SRS1_11402 [Sporisorium reilianum f. sp. reilianum]|uniref:Uncharacterized protein n=1 Tax=Sporisorium reilianum f. sp. reilianum TaxID=72559 RepID=A0A2N8U630_9BASI|nr:uncharacterized protein SRS1_11402 [Sporisorium reilianum f. sp. reilianum]
MKKYGVHNTLHACLTAHPKFLSMVTNTDFEGHLGPRSASSVAFALAVADPKAEEMHIGLATNKHWVNISSVRTDPNDKVPGPVIKDCYHVAVWDPTHASKLYAWTLITTDQKCGFEPINLPDVLAASPWSF